MERCPPRTQEPEEPRDDDALLEALDPSLGIFAGVESLAAPMPGLPVAVRGRLVGGVFDWPRVVYGRGATSGDALVSVVSAALERIGFDRLDCSREVPGIVMGTGARTTIDAAVVRARGALGCSVELSGAGEHAALEAWERRAVARAWRDGQFEVRLDDRAEPPPVGRVLDWHRGRGCRVTSVLLDRGPPVVACIAAPVDDDAPALVGVAAARTGGGAWRAAALELHEIYLARCMGARSGDLRGRRGGVAGARVMGVASDHAIDRRGLDAAIAATRRVIDPGTIGAWSQPIAAIAVELTPPVAARLNRRVVAAVLRDP